MTFNLRVILFVLPRLHEALHEALHIEDLREALYIETLREALRRLYTKLYGGSTRSPTETLHKALHEALHKALYKTLHEALYEALHEALRTEALHNNSAYDILRTTALLRRLYIKTLCGPSCGPSCKALCGASARLRAEPLYAELRAEPP